MTKLKTIQGYNLDPLLDSVTDRLISAKRCNRLWTVCYEVAE